VFFFLKHDIISFFKKIKKKYKPEGKIGPFFANLYLGKMALWPGGDYMRRLAFLIMAFLFFLPSISPAKELSKIAVWDLAPGDIKPAYAQDLTAILVSEISKLEKYEVYSQENMRTLAGWTSERMTLGCTDTKCLTALGQMDIAKLVSGRVGKIGNTYSISLNLFDTQNTKAEKAVSEFSRSEDDLVNLVQTAVRKLFGLEISTSASMEKVPEKTQPRATLEPLTKKLEGSWKEKGGTSDSNVKIVAEGDRITIIYVKPSTKMSSYGYLPGHVRFRGTYTGSTLLGMAIYRDNDPRWVRCRGSEWEFPATGSVSLDGNSIALQMSFTDIHWNDCTIKNHGVTEITFQRSFQ